MLLVFGVGVAAFLVWCQVHGTRLDQIMPDPFFGFSRHQWGILLSGGVGAALAVLGVIWTLRAQARQFDAQQEMRNRAEAKRVLTKVAPVFDIILERLKNLSGAPRHVWVSQKDLLMRLALDLIELDSHNQYFGGVIWDVSMLEDAFLDEKVMKALSEEELRDVCDALSAIKSLATVWTIRNPADRSGDLTEAYMALAAISIIVREHDWKGQMLYTENLGPEKILKKGPKGKIKFN